MLITFELLHENQYMIYQSLRTFEIYVQVVPQHQTSLATAVASRTGKIINNGHFAFNSSQSLEIVLQKQTKTWTFLKGACT